MNITAEKYRNPISRKDLEKLIDKILNLIKEKVDELNKAIKEPDYEKTEALRYEIRLLLKDLKEAEKRQRKKTE